MFCQVYALTISLLNRLADWRRRHPIATASGQAMVEYALMIAFLSVLVIGALHFLQGGLSNTFNTITNNL